jgi:hypothetical protein
MEGFPLFRRIQVAAATLILGLGIPMLAAAQSGLVPSFDWSVPDRFTANGMKGVKLPFAGVGASQTNANMRILNPERAFGSVSPAGWPAAVNACASTGPIASYIWVVDGHQVAQSANCKGTTLRFPREGRYRVELTVVSSSGATATLAQDVNIQDWLIIGLGDSYGSGEGNPNIEVKPQKYVDLNVALAVLEDASEVLAAAQARLAAAQADVTAAKAALAAARADYAGLYAAFQAFLDSLEELAAAQAALISANAALAAATAQVTAATALVVFECAQWWDPAGCTAAKLQLATAKKIRTAAAAAVAKATIRLAEATAEAARTALTVPAEGFEFTLGVLQARVDLFLARVATVEALLQTAKDAAAFASQTYQTALKASAKRAKEIVAKWQDSLRVGGQIIYPLPPFYRPDPYSQCHQSKFSGQAQAALAIEVADPKTSVTFIHLACTGATVFTGLFDSPDPAGEPPATLREIKPQLVAAAELSDGREVDAFVTSIGGNDIKFAKIIEQCAQTEPCFTSIEVQAIPDDRIEAMCDPFDLRSVLPDGVTPFGACEAWLREKLTAPVGSTDAAELFEKGINGDPAGPGNAEQWSLVQKYAELDRRLREDFVNFTPDRMFITPYPNVTRDQDGNICGDSFDPASELPGISPAEYQWAEEVVLRRLNDTVAQQAATLGWTFVDGIEQSFRLHGYCSTNPWMVRIGESFARQMDYLGTAHPNVKGHESYRDKIYAALRDAFYPEHTAGSLGAARVDRRP